MLNEGCKIVRAYSLMNLISIYSPTIFENLFVIASFKKIIRYFRSISVLSFLTNRANELSVNIHE